MDPITGMITGGASLMGSLFSSMQSGQNTQAQIQASQQQQATQNQFTQQMSNTAYQRASADMKAAGLNPMMMFGSGSAASTPSGSSIQAPMPQTKSPLGDLGANVRDGLSAAVTAKTLDKMTDEIANLQAERGLVTAKTDTEKQERDVKFYEARHKAIGIPQAELGRVTAEDVLSMPKDIRQSIVQGQFQEKNLGGAVGGIVGAVKHGAKAARDWWNGSKSTDSPSPWAGGNLSDRFNDVYGNSQ